MFVGNDIVAYKHQRCIGKWQQPLFLQKILSETEMNYLFTQQNKDACLWTYWTLKEAAYKLSCFLGNRNKFHAKEFDVVQLNINEMDIQNTIIPFSNTQLPLSSINSTIVYKGLTFIGSTLLTHQFVHSLVFDEPNNKNQFIYGVGEHKNYNKNDYSYEVRSFTKQYLQKNGIDFLDIEKDENGIPYLLTKNNQSNYISLSHDQQFVSFALVYNKSK